MNKISIRSIYAELKESSYPIYIWGAGSMSVEVEKRLEENGIPIGGKFINVGERENVYTLNEIERMHALINVVVGHGHYEKVKEIESYDFVNHVYIIPNPYLQYKIPDSEYIFANQDKIEYIKKHLSDDVSNYVFEQYIKFCVSSNIKYLLESDICIDKMYKLDALKIHKERFVDIGAWEGDSIESFLDYTNGDYDKIYAIEPDPFAFDKLKNKYGDKENIILLQCGVGVESGRFHLEKENTQSAFLIKEGSPDNISVEVRTIDSLFEGKMVSLIKIFVPFMFLDILRGSENILRKDKPKLIINIGADNKFQIYDVIKWITDLRIDYRLALRFDFPMPTSLFLYAY